MFRSFDTPWFMVSITGYENPSPLRGFKQIYPSGVEFSLTIGRFDIILLVKKRIRTRKRLPEHKLEKSDGSRPQVSTSNSMAEDH